MGTATKTAAGSGVLAAAVLAAVALWPSAAVPPGEPYVFIPTYGSTGDHGRYLNPQILDQGHSWTVERMSRYYAQGSRRFVAHLPFGRSSSEPMDLDGYAESMWSGNRAVVDVAKSFVPEMRRFFDEHPEVVVYFYLGTPLEDPDMVRLEEERARYLYRWYYAHWPILQLADSHPRNTAIAYDKAHQVDADHPLAGLMLSMQSMLEHPVMIEGGRDVREWQAAAGFSRIMLPMFLADGPVPNWPGEQIALARNGRYRDMPDDWREEMIRIGFNSVCGY